VHLLSNGVTAERHDTLIDMVGRQVPCCSGWWTTCSTSPASRRTDRAEEGAHRPLGLSANGERGGPLAVAGRGQELVLRLPAGHVRFMADGVRLEQIVSNLLSNASKYTQVGGTIELAGAKEGSDVSFDARQRPGHPAGHAADDL